MPKAVSKVCGPTSRWFQRHPQHNCEFQVRFPILWNRICLDNSLIHSKGKLTWNSHIMDLWIIIEILIRQFLWRVQNLCLLSLAFIIEWKVVCTLYHPWTNILLWLFVQAERLTFPQFLLLDHKWYYWLLVHQLWFNGKKNIVLYYNSEKSLYPLDMASSEIEKKKMAGNRRKFSGWLGFSYTS